MKPVKNMTMTTMMKRLLKQSKQKKAFAYRIALRKCAAEAGKKWACVGGQ